METMNWRPLTQNIRVSPLGLGTVKFGRNEQVKYPESFELPSDGDIHRLLDTAREAGVNLLDTAPAYGASEERLGRLLAERGETDDWVLSSKAGEEFADGESRFDFSPDAIRRSVERSLRRLGRERLELLLLHSDGDDTRILRESGAVEVLRELRDAGKLGAIGVSSKTVEGGRLAIELGLDAVMVAYNPGYREEEPVLDAAAAAGRAVLVKKALGSGWGIRDTGGGGPDPGRVAESFRFVFAHPATTAVIVGTLNPENLAANARYVDEATREGADLTPNSRIP
ncbi:MAG: aldo/keto reductase [Verrucomicrobiae bacterium]|nr:aldo/keto reductase [Verrucomicrobiae bacterium]MCP5540295.1 aldo/keto reductase [Akkermansiaceae bacterium]